MHSKLKNTLMGLTLAAGVVCAPAVLADENWQDDWDRHYANEEDPWESLNRKVFVFNDTLDRWALRPVAVGYQKITPQPVRTGVRNFFGNLGEGKNLFNNLLQAKFRDAGIDTSRFLFNTTFGVFGVFDVATKMGLQRNDEDFGQTLGKWGVESGPYVVLPLLGPSTVRDAPALIPDYYSSVYPLIDRDRYRYGLSAVDAVKVRESLLRADELVGAGDKYSFVRNAWLQNREYRVLDGEVVDDF